MSNMLGELLGAAMAGISVEKIKFDPDKAATVSDKLGRISAAVENSVTQLEGPMAEAQPVWTGQAAENFFAELEKLVQETRDIAEKVNHNKQQLDQAAQILRAGDEKASADVSSLSVSNTFIY